MLSAKLANWRAALGEHEFLFNFSTPCPFTAKYTQGSSATYTRSDTHQCIPSIVIGNLRGKVPWGACRVDLLSSGAFVMISFSGRGFFAAFLRSLEIFPCNRPYFFMGVKFLVGVRGWTNERTKNWDGDFTSTYNWGAYTCDVRGGFGEGY